MNILAIYELPIWLFVMCVAMLCLIVSGYLTCRRKRATIHAIAGQKQRLPTPEALVLGTSGSSRLPHPKFCPACGKQMVASDRTGTCGFCGHIQGQARRQTRRFSTFA